VRSKTCKIGLLRKTIFMSRFKLIWPVQPSAQKYSCLRKSEIMHSVAVLPPSEGRYAIVTGVGGRMRWTRWPCETSAAGADGEVVWSCPPDAGDKLCEMMIHAGDGG